METTTTFDTVMSGILDNGKQPKDSDALQAQADDLREQLKAAMVAGSIEKIVDTQNKLKQIPVIQRAFELKELRENLISIDAQFKQLVDDETALLSAVAEQKKLIVPVLDEAQRIGNEIARLEFALSLVYSNRQGLHEERRMKKAAISDRMNAITKEVQQNGKIK